ncbi:hypothetical protein D9M68_20190 [compost metagenome]
MVTKATGVVTAAELQDFVGFCTPENFNTEAEANTALRKGLRRLIEGGYTLTMQRTRLQKGDVFYVTPEQAKAARWQYKVVNQYYDIGMQVSSSSLIGDECSTVSTTCARLLIIELKNPDTDSVIDCLLDPETGMITVLDSDLEEHAPNGPVTSFVQLLTQP